MMRLLALVLMLWPGLSLAQGAATLVADTVTLSGDDQLIATGNVEVLYQDNRLSATQIIYDRSTDQLTITGPMIVRAPDGTILTADRAELDPRLENGILQGARLVLDQQLQLVANQIDRVDGRYSQLYKTAATSCQVCGNRPPLWDIRAERVIHDQQAQQLYFRNAIFRIRGVPLVWLPRMRLPDPTLKRATGFLIPRQRNTNLLGTGIKTPYFITLGNSRDLTLTPYLSPQTRTMELIYRQAFAAGDLRIVGAVSDDSLEDDNRSYVFATGQFLLSDGFQLSFDVEVASDPAYLPDYGYSDKDRLDSAIELLRVGDRTLTEARLTYYQTLREDENNASLPPFVAEANHEVRFEPSFGGTMTLGASADTIYRYSTTDGDAGRDVGRAGARAQWSDTWIGDTGLERTVKAGLRADVYRINDDSSYGRTDLRAVPYLATVLRWPFGRTNANGAVHLIEPVVSLAWSDAFGSTPPNEDSTRNEFDQANLLDLSRFAGDDAVETGAQVAAGLTWTRAGSRGTTSTLTFGRILRQEGIEGFSTSSGLDGAASDWLVAGQIVTPEGFVLDLRTLFDSDTSLTRAASRIGWRNDAISLNAAYIWQASDLAEDRPETISEWSFDGDFTISQAWKIGLDGRYDVAADRPVRAGLGLEWRNECVTIDVSASRRYTSSTTVEPTTTFGLSATLNGFSAGRSGSGPAAQCRN